MKARSTLKMLSCLCLMAVLSAPAFAEGEAPPSPDGPATEKSERHHRNGPFTRMDADKDGFVTQGEILEHFTQFDADKDGKISQDEWREHMKEVFEKRKEKRGERGEKWERCKEHMGKDRHDGEKPADDKKAE